MKKSIILITFLAIAQFIMSQGLSHSEMTTTKFETLITDKLAYEVSHNQIDVDGVSIFYREAGNPTAETIVMMHGFPSSSHMFRNVIDGLSDQYHIIAPDYPGFGFSEVPNADEFEYTFDNITKVTQDFINKLGIDKFYLMMQDYGGPIGMRIASENPNRIQGLIIQNANAYMEGLGEWSQRIGGYVQNEQFTELEEFKTFLMSAEGVKTQYTAGSKNPVAIDALSYLTDIAFLDRTNVREVQSALFNNYGTNFPKYGEWQSYLKRYQPKTLVLWGENDKYFSKAGGEAYKKDLKDVEVHFFDAGHFMLEEFPDESIELISTFLNKN